MATAKTRQKLLNTFLDLLADHPYADISLSQVAEAAKVKLSDFRGAFHSKMALVEAFYETIDKAVLDERDSDMGDQPPRDRLFDILMTRIDAMAEHKDAVRALAEAGESDPGLALEFNRLAVRSQKWMLVAAGIEVSGLKASIMAQGLAIAFGRVLRTWLDEPDEGMPRTMARLDRELDNGTSFMKRLNSIETAAKGMRSILKAMSGRSRHRRHREDDDMPDDLRDDPGVASARM